MSGKQKEPQVPLSIEESIQKLKAEIIAQDWRLSPNRASRLEAAFSCLGERFRSRKATSAMLVMAGSVLSYIKKFGGEPPDTIDFLKEAMAHVVNLYEDLSFDPEKEEKIFQSLYCRFTALKGKIKQKQAKPLPEPPLVEESGSFHPNEVLPSGDDLAPEFVSEGKKINAETDAVAKDVEQLISDLKQSLARADEVGTAIGKILEELQDEKNTVVEVAVVASGSADVSAGQEKTSQIVKTCPPTELCCVTIGNRLAAVPVSSIALIKPVSAAKLKIYLRNSNIPLKDFAGFLQKLAPQFAGNLSAIKDGKLKKLTLPLMLPQGFDLPEVVDDKAGNIVVLSHGDWHGGVACNAKSDEPETMVKFESRKNGDIAGIGHLQSGGTIDIIDVLSILQREGFLFMA